MGLCTAGTVSPDDEPGLAIVVELAEQLAQRLVSWVERGVVDGVVRRLEWGDLLRFLREVPPELSDRSG